MKKVYNLIKFGVVVLFSLMAVGCSFSNIEPSEMAANAQVVKHHQGSVQVKVTGGETKEDQLKITNESFKQSIVNAINKSKLFGSTGDGKSDYRLDVILNSLDQPAMGFTMTVNMEASWIVTRISDNKMMWRKSISSTQTLGVSDETGGVARVRRTTGEAAARNIEKALAEISKLDL